jgi:tetratricopeptide (TPR) repeat protein
MICIKGARMVITLVLLFLCQFVKADTQHHFYFSPVCIEAQKHIAALRLNKAQQLLSAEKKLHPDNVAIPFLENYIDYYRIVTSQDYSELKKIEQAKDVRLKAVRKISTGSPYYLYAQSEMHLQWGFIKSFNQEYVGAMLEFRNAYQLAKENFEKYPDFKPSMKTVGMFRTLLGTIPNNYKWVLGVTGLTGDFDGGMQLLQRYFRGDTHQEFILDKQSTEFYYTLFMLNFGDKQKAWAFCNEHTMDYNANLLSVYLRAYTASKSGKNDESIHVLQHRPKSSDYEPFYALDYYLGMFKLNRLDDDAEQSLKRFVSFYKGKLYMKDAYRRISWCYLLKNDLDKYKIYRELSKRYGSTNSEEDKNIMRETELGITHDLIILKARLLFDGGYYVKAEETIKQRNPDQLKTEYQRLEYYYRYARILHEQNKYNKATDYYEQVVKLSPVSTPYYFAPYACLHMGYIYQKMGFGQIAKSHFSKVELYTKAEYHESIKVKSNKELQKLK